MADQKEAFCLMMYECEKCKHIEYIWNSRNAVTPFMVGASCCEGEIMAHAYFGEDRPSLALPAFASRVFINRTKESAKEAAHKYWDLHGEKLMEEYEHLKEIGKEELMKSKIEEIYSSFGAGTTPHLVSRAEYLELYNQGKLI